MPSHIAPHSSRRLAAGGVRRSRTTGYTAASPAAAVARAKFSTQNRGWACVGIDHPKLRYWITYASTYASAVPATGAISADAQAISSRLRQRPTPPTAGRTSPLPSAGCNLFAGPPPAHSSDPANPQNATPPLSHVSTTVHFERPVEHRHRLCLDRVETVDTRPGTFARSDFQPGPAARRPRADPTPGFSRHVQRRDARRHANRPA